MRPTAAARRRRWEPSPTTRHSRQPQRRQLLPWPHAWRRLCGCHARCNDHASTRTAQTPHTPLIKQVAHAHPRTRTHTNHTSALDTCSKQARVRTLGSAAPSQRGAAPPPRRHARAIVCARRGRSRAPASFVRAVGVPGRSAALTIRLACTRGCMYVHSLRPPFASEGTQTCACPLSPVSVGSPRLQPASARAHWCHEYAYVAAVRARAFVFDVCPPTRLWPCGPRRRCLLRAGHNATIPARGMTRVAV